MAKNIYFGVGGVAKKVKKVYIGIGGVARKVKKAYIGIANVARLFFSGGELEYVGLATNLSNRRFRHGATTIGNYALFGGGNWDSASVKSVESYNSVLTKTSTVNLSVARDNLAASHNTSYALFSCGRSGNASTSTKTVDAFNNSLTRTSAPDFRTTTASPRSVSFGNYVVVFGGGTKYIDAYNTSLTKSSLTDLPYKLLCTCAMASSYAAFLIYNTDTINTSAYTTTYSTSLIAYNQSLTQSIVTAPFNFSATFANSKTFLGVKLNDSYSIWANSDKKAYCTNQSLTFTQLDNLAYGRGNGNNVATVGEYAIMGGGGSSPSGLDVYDINLVHTVFSPDLSEVGSRSRSGVAVTTVGDYALFGGGAASDTNNGWLVDVYSA